MSELAEGTRLEIVCAANTGTVGSNPTLSATISVACCFHRAVLWIHLRFQLI
jgi:hypothetical protein